MLVSSGNRLRSFYQILSFGSKLSIRSFVRKGLCRMSKVVSGKQLIFASMSVCLGSSKGDAALFGRSVGPRFPLDAITSLRVSPFSAPFGILAGRAHGLLTSPGFSGKSVRTR